jgi:putative glutathione S-transferase
MDRMWNNEQGEFVRYKSKFRNQIKADGSTPFQPEAWRYHLYISWACPWAHRTAIVRKVLGLEDAISLSVVDPVWNEAGWTFKDGPGNILDFVNQTKDLIDIYRLADPAYNDEETTPVLWDKKTKTIVSNESIEIIKMFATEFGTIAKNKIELYPADLRSRIDEIVEAIYPSINNGVYRAGFATDQRPYERAYAALFDALDSWELELAKKRFMCGEKFTLADICLFTTLFRFDLVYYSHFKCNRQHVYEYKNLWGHTCDIYNSYGIADTCHTDHIKRHYYISQKVINPTQVVPVGPVLEYPKPIHRENLGRGR